MELRRYLGMLKQRWWLFLLPLLGTVALTLFLTSREDDSYEADTTLVVRPVDESEGSKATDILIRAAEITPTFARVATSDNIDRQARDAMEARGLILDGIGDVTLKSDAVTGTTVLRLNATGPDPDLLAPYLEEVAKATVDYVDSLSFVFTLSPLDAPKEPDRPEGSNRTLSLVLGAFLGAVLGGVLVFLAEYLALPDEQGRELNILDPEVTAYNEAFFRLRFDAELGRARRLGEVFSVGMIKVLPRKEGRGSAPTTEDLEEVAESLQDLCRSEDLVCRVGDDTFLVMLPGMRHAEADDAMSACPALLWPDTSGVAPPLSRYTVSVGVCEYGADIIAPKELPRVSVG